MVVQHGGLHYTFKSLYTNKNISMIIFVILHVCQRFPLNWILHIWRLKDLERKSEQKSKIKVQCNGKYAKCNMLLGRRTSQLFTCCTAHRLWAENTHKTAGLFPDTTMWGLNVWIFPLKYLFRHFRCFSTDQSALSCICESSLVLLGRRRLWIACLTRTTTAFNLLCDSTFQRGLCRKLRVVTLTGSLLWRSLCRRC